MHCSLDCEWRGAQIYIPVLSIVIMPPYGEESVGTAAGSAAAASNPAAAREAADRVKRMVSRHGGPFSGRLQQHAPVLAATGCTQRSNPRCVFCRCTARVRVAHPCPSSSGRAPAPPDAYRCSCATSAPTLWGEGQQPQLQGHRAERGYRGPQVGWLQPQRPPLQEGNDGRAVPAQRRPASGRCGLARQRALLAVGPFKQSYC